MEPLSYNTALGSSPGIMQLGFHSNIIQYLFVITLVFNISMAFSTALSHYKRFAPSNIIIRRRHALYRFTQLKMQDKEDGALSPWDTWEYGTFNARGDSTKGTGISSILTTSPSKRKRMDPMWQHISEEEILRGIDILKQFISEERKAKFQTVLDQRSDRFRFVFENPSNPNNIWAALRTFDAFGIQNVDIILDNKSDASLDGRTDVASNASGTSFTNRGTMTSALGAQKWLTLRQYDDSMSCIESLKKQGYTILATDIHSGSVSLMDIDWQGGQGMQSKKLEKVAFVMGNELKGISMEMRKLADCSFYIPMKGFAESLNLSVACAVICSKLQTNGLLIGNLDLETKNRIMFSWLTRSVKGSTDILRRYKLQGVESDDRVYNSIGSITTKP